MLSISIWRGALTLVYTIDLHVLRTQDSCDWFESIVGGMHRGVNRNATGARRQMMVFVGCESLTTPTTGGNIVTHTSAEGELHRAYYRLCDVIGSVSKLLVKRTRGVKPAVVRARQLASAEVLDLPGRTQQAHPQSSQRTIGLRAPTVGRSLIVGSPVSSDTIEYSNLKIR